VRSVGLCLDVPAQDVDKRPGRRRRGGAGRWQLDRRVVFDHGRLRGEDGPNEVVRGVSLAHDLVGEADPETLLEAEEKLDPLEAADPEVTIE